MSVGYPEQVSDFWAWGMAYVQQHHLEKGCSTKEWEQEHRAIWEAKAQEFGLTMHRDGSLTVNKPQ